METSGNLSGQISLSFSLHLNIVDFFIKHIPGYDSQRFNIVAIRVFSGEEFVVTLYAEDKQHVTSIHPGKLMVKKFKIVGISHEEFFMFTEGYNFTVFNKEYDVTQMEVINK